MPKNRGLIKVKDRSVPLLYMMVILPLIVAILAQFGVIDLSGQVVGILTILSGFFVLTEVGAMGLLRGKKFGKDATRIFGAIVAILAIAGATLTFFNLEIAFLIIVGGLVNILLIVYVIIEGFR